MTAPATPDIKAILKELRGIRTPEDARKAADRAVEAAMESARRINDAVYGVPNRRTKP